jgi:hypothetical protein
MNQKLKAITKDAIGVIHRAALKAGVVVLPNHYHTPIADVHELQQTQRFWSPPSL